MILRRIFAALALLCVLMAPAYAQKTKAALTSEINTNWPDNTSGAITPSLLRSTVIDIVNSYVDWLTCTGTGGIVYWSGGVPSCLAAGVNGQHLILISGLPAWSNITSSLSAGTCITITGTITPTIGVTSGCINTAQLANNAVTNAILAQMAGPGLKGTTLSSTTANVSDLTPGQVGSILCTPVRNTFTSGSSQTYTTPTCNSITATWLEVDVQGGGAGGGGSGTTTTAGTGGNASSFGALTASGGSTPTGGTTVGGAGGTCSGSLGTQQNFIGTAGSSGPSTLANSLPGGAGGVSFYGGLGPPSFQGNAGQPAPANSGGGGSGGSGSATAGVLLGAGGGAGCHIRTVIVSPVAATYTYTVGGTAAGASAGAGPGSAGGAGAAGLIDIIAHWQ